MAGFFSTIGRILGLAQDEPPRPDWSVPSYDDVCQARASLKALNLPTELVLQILDFAHYWPQYEYVGNFRQPKVAAAQGGRPSHATLCADIDALNNTTVEELRRYGETCKVKSVEFNIASLDQAWTSENTHGTFNTSSWLEVSILRKMDHNTTAATGLHVSHMRFNDPSDYHQAVSSQGWSLVKRPESAKQGPQDGEGDFAWYLQGNRVAVGLDEYRIVWSADDQEGNEGAGNGEGFLNELTEGDRVLVWARAKVSCCSVREYYRLTSTVARMAMHCGKCEDDCTLWFLIDEKRLSSGLCNSSEPYAEHCRRIGSLAKACTASDCRFNGNSLFSFLRS